MKITINPKYAGLQNVRNFVDIMGDIAVKVYQDTGLNPCAFMGQIALETGWLSNVLMVRDAKDFNLTRYCSKNLGNIRWVEGCGRKSGWAWVDEIINGVRVWDWGLFRVYDSYDESVQDYIHLLSTSSVYAEAWANRGGIEKFAYAMRRYASAPDYSEKIIATAKAFILGA